MRLARGAGRDPISGFRLLELELVKFGIYAPGLEQLCVLARFDDAPAIQHHDDIGLLNRGKPVGDADRGAALHELFERRLDDPFGFGIERAGGLVQD